MGHLSSSLSPDLSLLLQTSSRLPNRSKVTILNCFVFVIRTAYLDAGIIAVIRGFNIKKREFLYVFF